MSISLFSDEQLEILKDSNNCLAFVDGTEQYTQYSYRPSLGAGIAFCVLFAIPFFWQFVQTIRFRRWTSVLLGLGALSKSFHALL